jgi:hypothetical protein
MAEADFAPYIAVVITGSMLAIVLSELRRRRIHKAELESYETVRTYSKKEKRNFRQGFVVGIIVGFLVYIQHIFDMFGLELPWFLPLIQLYPIIFFLTISFVYAGVRILIGFTKIVLSEKKFGYADGIFMAFILIQAIVFIQYPLEFVPMLEK